MIWPVSERIVQRGPLCPAGHLPREGGDYAVSATRLISPLAEEMGGSPEGGVQAQRLKSLLHDLGKPLLDRLERCRTILRAGEEGVHVGADDFRDSRIGWGDGA